MTRNRILIAALATAFAAGMSTAAVAAGDKQQSAAGTTPMATKEPFSKLDTDKDGYVGRIEAAADADAKSRFETLDSNKDGKLSRSEYEASGAMGAASGAPVSASKKGASVGGTPKLASTVPMLVLLPVQNKIDPMAQGCWARMYNEKNFQGDSFTLVGPIDMANMRGPFGISWENKIRSIETGPKANVTIFDDEGFRDKDAKIAANKKVPEMDSKLGLFEDFSSMKINC